jgi:hypothetical protein
LIIARWGADPAASSAASEFIIGLSFTSSASSIGKSSQHQEQEKRDSNPLVIISSDLLCSFFLFACFRPTNQQNEHCNWFQIDA